MSKRFILTFGIGCAVLLLLVIVAIPLAFLLPVRTSKSLPDRGRAVEVAATSRPDNARIQAAVPTITVGQRQNGNGPSVESGETLQELPQLKAGDLVELYDQVNPGVVNIQVFVRRGESTGQGAGSGFILDEDGHIVTNNHVVDQAEQVTVIFYDGTEARAEILGTDPDSDLAVIRVDQYANGARPLTVGDSDQVHVGQWVVAIGNPFGLGSSMSTGIVSAVGRTIPTGVTPFSIPQAIQTDAAINPGNSGGPLIDLAGQVIGVNAQIATGGAPANAGVGFAIPANIVRRVIPVLIEAGAYQWPWLGVEGGSVNLVIQEANNLPSQLGAYLNRVVPDSPAQKAGLRGSSATAQIRGLEVPVGGDVVVEADGDQIRDFSDLLVHTAFQELGDDLQLTIIRDRERLQITVELEARPADFTR